MLKFAKLGALVAACAMLAAPALAADKVAVKVNGVSIPESRITAQLKEAGYPDTPEARGTVLARTVRVELLAQEAIKKGMDKNSDVTDRITEMQALARSSVLANAFVHDYLMNHPVSEDALRKEYDGIKHDPRMVQYKLAHIVVKTKKEANAISAKLRHGGNFAKLATKHSMDKASGAQGGEIGWVSPNGLQGDFAKAITHLKRTGQTTRPIQTGPVWQIVKLLGKRVTPFEDAKPMLMRPLRNAELQKLMDDLRTKAKIEEQQ